MSIPSEAYVADNPPDPATLHQLVTAFGPGHDITALLTAAVRSPAFRAPASVLVKEPVLWLVAALRALRLRASKLPQTVLAATLTGLGQIPFAPPNVGGWPAGLQWLTTAAALTRLQVATRLATLGDISPVTDAAPADRVDATAALLSLPTLTDRTRGALRTLTYQPAQLVGPAIASPETPSAHKHGGPMVSSLTRRRFLTYSGGAAAIAAAAAAAGVSWATLVSRARTDPLPVGTGVVVMVTLYGGNDGLNTVIPAGPPPTTTPGPSWPTPRRRYTRSPTGSGSTPP